MVNSMNDKELLEDISVLIVDDERVILDAITDFLKLHVKSVYKAQDGEIALKIYKEKRPDISIIDIAMPEMNGFELISAIRNINKDASIIVCSAYDEKEFLLNAITLGVNEYITKPIDRTILLEYIIKCAKDLKLKRENEKLSTIQNLILNAIQDGVFGLDINGNHTFINPAAALMLGYTQEELIGKPSHTTWHHTKKDGTPYPQDECLIYKVLKDGVKIKVENDIFWRKDGSSFIASYISSPLIGSHGEILGAVVTFWDVTEKRKKDERLKIFSLAIEENPSAIMITDPEGVIEYANKRFFELSGYKEDEVLGNTPRIVRYEKNPKELYEKMWSDIKSGKIWEGEIKNRKKDGSNYWCRVSIFPLFDENGLIYKFVGITTDISKNKEYEEKLKEINQDLETRIAKEVQKNREKDMLLFEQAKLVAIGDMIKDIAHHWRQPLTAIGMMIHNIKDSYDFGELNKNLLDDLVNKCMEQLQVMSKTIDNFRTFFKPNEKKTKFNIKKAIEEAIFMISIQLKIQFIETVITKSPDAPDEIFGYQNDFKQVSLNIIKNSADAIIERTKKENKGYKGKIQIDIIKKENMLSISYKDNGGGIPEEIVDKIFNPYFSTKSQQSGTGIGLYMSKTVIEKNFNGTIKYNKIDDGAEFVIEIPLDQIEQNFGNINM